MECLCALYLLIDSLSAISIAQETMRVFGDQADSSLSFFQEHLLNKRIALFLYFMSIFALGDNSNRDGRACTGKPEMAIGFVEKGS